MSQSNIDSSQYSENDPMIQTKVMPKRKPGIQLQMFTRYGHIKHFTNNSFCKEFIFISKLHQVCVIMLIISLMMIILSLSHTVAVFQPSGPDVKIKIGRQRKFSK